VLKNNDNVGMNGEVLDERLRRARRVVVFVSWGDQSAVTVDLRARRIDQLAWSANLGERLWRLQDDLRAGSKSRLVTDGWAWALALWPLVLLPAFFLAVIVDPELRQFILAEAPAEGAEAPIPQWLFNIRLPVLVTWPLALIVAMCIVGVRLTPGGCRVWPRALSNVFALNLLYRIRAEGFRIENWRTLIFGVLTGFLLTALTAWIL